MKAEGRDILRPGFTVHSDVEQSSQRPPSPLGIPVKQQITTMTNPEIQRKITVEEFEAQAQNKNWVRATFPHDLRGSFAGFSL